MKELAAPQSQAQLPSQTRKRPGRKPSPLLFPMRLASGLASAALVILLALDATVFFRSGMLDHAAAPPAAPLAASEAMSAEKAHLGEMSNEIILWATPTVEAFGKGGGRHPSMESGTLINASVPQPSLHHRAEAPAQAPPADASGLPAEATADSLQKAKSHPGYPPRGGTGQIELRQSRQPPAPQCEDGFPLRRALNTPWLRSPSGAHCWCDPEQIENNNFLAICKANIKKNRPENLAGL